MNKRPVISSIIAIRLRLHARSEGKGFREINKMMAGFNQSTIVLASAQTGVAIPDWETDGESDDEIDYSLGTVEAAQTIAAVVGEDKTLIQRLLDFLKSEQGQALIKFLFSLLIGLI